MGKVISWLKHINPILSIAYVCVIIGLFVLSRFLCLISETYNIGGNLTPEEMAQTGQVGDFIGGVIGSVWALAGVFLYFSALKLQQQELKSQREEMATSQKLLDQQLFEGTFFNLLKAQENIRDNIKAQFPKIEFKAFSLSVSQYEVYGINFFNIARTEYQAIYNFVASHEYKGTSIHDINEDIENQIGSFYDKFNDIIINEELWDTIKYYAYYECLGTLYGSNEKTFKTIHESGNERQICAYAYWLFYHRYEYCLGHYCRHFYNIIKYIDDYKQKLLSQLNSQSKDYEKEVQTINDKIHHYFSFAQASLSSYELVMIYYNMLLFPNAEKLYKEYNIFENMHIENLIKNRHARFFEGIKIKSVKDFKQRIFQK